MKKIIIIALISVLSLSINITFAQKESKKAKKGTSHKENDKKEKRDSTAVKQSEIKKDSSNQNPTNQRQNNGKAKTKIGDM